MKNEYRMLTLKEVEILEEFNIELIKVDSQITIETSFDLAAIVKNENSLAFASNYLKRNEKGLIDDEINCKNKITSLYLTKSGTPIQETSLELANKDLRNLIQNFSKIKVLNEAGYKLGILCDRADSQIPVDIIKLNKGYSVFFKDFTKLKNPDCVIDPYSEVKINFNKFVFTSPIGDAVEIDSNKLEVLVQIIEMQYGLLNPKI